MANILMEALKELRQDKQLKESSEDISASSDNELIQSDSKEAFNHNLKVLLNSGKPRNQALAIAYSIQRKNKTTERTEWQFAMGEDDEALLKDLEETIKKHADENFWKSHHLYIVGDSGMGWTWYLGYNEEYGFCGWDDASGDVQEFNNFNDFFDFIISDQVLNLDTLEEVYIERGQITTDYFDFDD